MNTKSVRIAACQYGVEFFETWEYYERKLTRLIQEATKQRAELLVFPEYGAMGLASLHPSHSALPEQLDALQKYQSPYLELHRAFARKHEIHILAASFPVQINDHEYRNRAYLIAPNGSWDFQDKLIMTRFESETWGIKSGNTNKVFTTALGCIGIAICYDAEFPLLVRNQIEAGAEIILVPSCTDTEAGYHRVRIGAQARALENQCYVIQASTVGKAEWSMAIDNNVGAAAVYAPPNDGLTNNGICAIGPRDQPAWLYATLDLQRLRDMRSNGQTLNHRDWPKQQPAAPMKLQVVNL